MNAAQSVLPLVLLVVMVLWVVSAAQADSEHAAEARDSKVKPKKVFKEAAMLLQVVKNLSQLVNMIVTPILLLKGVTFSAFTALVTFFWFAYELLRTKEPTKLSLVLPSTMKTPLEEPTTTSRPSVAILPVVTSHDVHTLDYDDYDVYNYKQHFGNKRHNGRPNFHYKR